MEWMAWTTETAVLFVGIFVMLTVMAVWEAYSPPVTRKGFLPIPTDRGDRLYIGLIITAFIQLAWLGLTRSNQLWAVLISLLWMAAVLRWG